MSIYKLYLTKAYRKFHFDFPKDKNLSKLYNKIYQIKYESSLDFKYIDKHTLNLRLNEKLILMLYETRLSKFIYLFSFFNLPLIYPLPIDSVNLIKSYGIKVHKQLCSFLFFSLKILIFIKSLIYILQFSKYLVFKFNKYTNQNGILIHDYIEMFHYKKKYILKKSMEKAFKTKSVKFYFISKLVEKSETLINIHPKSNFITLFRFMFCSIAECFRVVYDDLIHKSNSIFLLNEIIENKYYELNHKNYQYNCILFSDISRNSKRLWFSSAEHKKIKIIYFAHSTNFVGSYPYSKFGDFIDPYFEFFSFKEILPIDNQIKKIHNEKLKNSKPFSFLENEYLLEDINNFSSRFKANKKIISIFDVPFRYPFDYSKYNFTNFIYKKKFLFNFYKSIAQKHKEDNIYFVIKPKKFLNTRQHSDFKKILNLVFSSKNYYIVNEINVLKLILKSELSYSVPFTTTGFLSKTVGRKYFYLNPDPNIDLNNIYEDINLLNG